MAQLIISACLALLLIGYAAGRRLGIADGRRRGEREAVIRLRDDAYAGGVCPICGYTARHQPPAPPVGADRARPRAAAPSAGCANDAVL